MISLIVSTRNRVDELHRLLASLEAQTYTAFEVILVDQNEDDRLQDVLAQHGTLPIRHLRSGAGVSKGRNVGLRAAQGDLVAFPDDDCWYPSDLLASVVAFLEEHPDYDGLLTGFRSPEGRLMTPRFPPREGLCTQRSVLRCTLAWNMFLRARAVHTVGFFREDVGPRPSSPKESGEDQDYSIRVVALGFRLWWAPALTVHHPELNSRERLDRTAHGYGIGAGRVLRINGYSWGFCLSEIVFRSFAGSAFYLCKGDARTSWMYLVRAAGQFQGYFLTPKQSGDARELQARGGRGT